jgi:hypothetical protein
MVGRNLRGVLAATRRARAADDETRYVTLGRVRLRSLARVAFRIGWFASLPPSLLTSAIGAWVLHNIWTTLDGWKPWTPWAPDTRILGAQLPTPEFAPREALRLEGMYQTLEPVGQHPFIAAALFTLLLTAIGGLVFALMVTSVGLTYNRFVGMIGGIEFELTERPARSEKRAGRGRGGEPDDWDDAKLRW